MWDEGEAYLLPSLPFLGLIGLVSNVPDAVSILPQKREVWELAEQLTSLTGRELPG